MWELKVSQCSVVGTCCTLAEIRKIGCRTGVIDPRNRDSDYRVHFLIVSELGRPGVTSRAVRKLLDDKYAGQIRKAGRLATCEEFREFWEESLEKGLAPGAYWALVSSAHVPDGFCSWLFGEIHMMSHLCGASARGALLHEVETAAARTEEFARLERENRSALKTIGELKGRLEESERRMAAMAARLMSAEARSASAPVAPVRQQEDQDRKRRATRPHFAELEYKRSLQRTLTRPDVGSVCASATPPPIQPRVDCDLNGCRLLYVGGLPSAVCKIRELTERCSGCFLHHDGGIEQSMGELEGLASKADVVLLPVRNVSHQAARRVKQYCVARGIPFKPLRSSSISAFNHALLEVRSGSLHRGGRKPDVPEAELKSS